MTDVVRPTVLDTDIGSDVDDLLALALLARAPEVDVEQAQREILHRLLHHA